jgi:hypothetical protein
MPARTLIKTTTTGWFLDAEDLDGKRVRKTDEDTILTREEFDALRNGKAPENAEQAAAKQAGTQAANAKTRKAAAAKDKPEPVVTTLTSGKVVTGETVEVRDAWVEPANRTKAQAKLFDSGFEGVPAQKTYDKVVAAAKGDKAALPSGAVRVVKKQDAFQVRFSVENQHKHRNELRRKKNAAKRAARKAAEKKA